MTDVMDEAKRLLEIFTEQLVENERLTIKLNAEHLVRQNVEVDNAKLRELVRKYTTVPCTCSRCQYLTDERDCELYVLARELGVEVDA